MTGRVTALLKAGARLLALAVLFTLFNPAGALAHAVLQATSPAADSVSAKAPDSIGLIFNEPVQLLALRIIDATGRDRSPPSTPEVRDGRVLWPIQDHLQDGRYLVSWRVVSLDGHVIAGSFIFAIGTANAAMLPMPAAAEGAHRPALALHAAARLTLLLAVGTALFRLLLSPPSLEPTLRKATRWLAISGIAAAILFIGAEGALRAGLPMTSVISIEPWQAAFIAGNIGPRLLMLTGLVLLALGGGRAIQWIGVASAIIGMGDSGHVIAVLPVGVGQGLTILHG